MCVKLLPIPYRGYELDLDNVYYDPKNKNDGLFKINCENYKPVRADCSIERLSTECAYALQNVRVENVISYCPFRDSQLKNPTQLLTGILIPNLDDFKVYVLRNFSDPDTGSILPLPTDTLTDVPLIVASERPIKVSEEKFEFIFRYSAQKSFIRFTSLSENDIAAMQPTFSDWDLEDWLLLASILLAGFGFTIFVTACIFCICCCKTKRKLKKIKRKHPEKRMPKEMKNYVEREKSKN